VLADLEQAARALDDDVMGFGFRRAGGERPGRDPASGLGLGLAEQLDRLGQRRGRCFVDGPAVGPVAVDQAQLSVAAPHRQRQVVEQRLEAVALGANAVHFAGQFGHVVEPQELGAGFGVAGGAGAGAPDFEHPAGVLAPEPEFEPAALVAQGGQRRGQALGVGGLEGVGNRAQRRLFLTVQAERRQQSRLAADPGAARGDDQAAERRRGQGRLAARGALVDGVGGGLDPLPALPIGEREHAEGNGEHGEADRGKGGARHLDQDSLPAAGPRAARFWGRGGAAPRNGTVARSPGSQAAPPSLGVSPAPDKRGEAGGNQDFTTTA
jgi:hypothetical protein